MLSAVVRVNDRLIGEVRVTNESRKLDGVCVYRWELHRHNASGASGTLTHDRADGAGALLSAVLAAAGEALRD